jgi:acyl-[acyl carrier protein]--UDP-N-acetylglucosamine O-acyltransferase
MSRAGLNAESQYKILQAYKLLYRNRKNPLLENAKALAANDDLDPNVRDILDSIMKSSQHRHGRYLETLRD